MMMTTTTMPGGYFALRQRNTVRDHEHALLRQHCTRNDAALQCSVNTVHETPQLLYVFKFRLVDDEVREA